MLPPVFYAEPDSCNGDIIKLSTAESHHAKSVLRLGRGQILMVVDGAGNAYRGEITGSSSGKTVDVAVHTRIRNWGEPMVKLTLAAGLSTGSKFDSIVQKGTELGVVRFAGLVCEKSKVKLEDSKRIKSRKTRLEKVTLAAMKQCRRSYRPEVAIPVDFEEFIKETDSDSLNVMFDPDGQQLSKLVFETDVRRVIALVGPESGFSAEEVDLATAAGFQVISLGPRVLRTETAGPVACALLMNLCGDLI
jgi:16S rRNA (uracil1498-N3)-methyltransferase